MISTRPAELLLRSSLLMLALAASTGALFRAQSLGVVQTPWTLENIRHAHSHLVLFGWAVPAMIHALALRYRPMTTFAPGGVWITVANQAFALASWPIFVVAGYGRIAVGDTSLPLGAMVSGLVLFAWYAWVARYIVAAPDPRSDGLGQRYAATAMLFLVLSSGGAWSVAASQFANLSPAATSFLTHTFLHLLALGFLGIGTTALLLRSNASSASRHALSKALWFGATGVLLSVLATSPHITNAPVVLAGRIGLLMMSGSTFAVATITWRSPEGVGALPRLFLLARGTAELALALAPVELRTQWIADPTLRVLYLHIVMVGGASAAIVETTLPRTWWRRVLVAGLASVVVLLLPLTALLPVAFRGAWAWWASIVAGLVVASVSLVLSFSRQRGQ